MEPLYGMTIAELTESKMVFKERHVRLVAHELLNAVEYMHTLGVVHRDLNPKNIFMLLDSNKKISVKPGHLKVIDFNVSAQVNCREPEDHFTRSEEVPSESSIPQMKSSNFKDF